MILAISAKSGSGKDLVADFLKEKGFTRLAFADAVKKVCKNYLGLADCELSDENKDKPIHRMGNRTGRELVIEVGEFFRGIYPTVWVDKIMPYLDLEYDYVITDLRFEQELTALRSFGATILRLERPNNNSTHPGHDHESESMADKPIYDYRIINDGSLEDLKLKVDRFLTTIKR